MIFWFVVGAVACAVVTFIAGCALIWYAIESCDLNEEEWPHG